MKTSKSLGRSLGSKPSGRRKSLKEKTNENLENMETDEAQISAEGEKSFEFEEFIPDSEDEKIVKKVYIEAATKYEQLRDTEGKAAFASSVGKPITNPFLSIDEIPTLEFPDEPSTKLMGVLKVQSEDSYSIQRRAIIPLEGVPRLPNMQYWTHTERNIRSEDERTLSHIPFIGESDKDLMFGEELMKEYEEGIHGVRSGWDRYINDWILHKMLAVLELKYDTEKRCRETLYKTIHYLFPNKCPVKKLQSIFMDLEARFKDPAVPAAEPFLQSAEGFRHSFETCHCQKCNAFDCQTHGLTEEGLSFNFRREYNDTKERTNEECGEKCYKRAEPLSKLSRSQIRWCKDKGLSNWFDKYLVDYLQNRGGLFNCCDAAVVMTHIGKDMRELGETEDYSCQEIYNYVTKQLDVKMPEYSVEFEKRSPKKKKTDQHQQFRHARYKVGEVSISHQVQPCNHPGKKCEPGVCDCVRDNNVCTKFCKCEDCANKFPGCKCAAGKCNTRQCSCYLANFECDPDLCHDCACDTTEEYTGPVICTNLQLQRGFQKRLRIGISEIAGWGCFVQEDCKKGDLISEYCGEVITTDECERRGRIYDKLKCSYIFNLNTEQAVDATRVGNLIRFANHSDDANCSPRVMIVNGEHRIGIFAQVDIKAGEEIFFNYSYDRVQKMQFVNKRRQKESGKAKEDKKKTKEKADVEKGTGEKSTKK